MAPGIMQTIFGKGGSKGGNHPFSPLSPEEISTASSILKKQYPEGSELHFKCVTLLEPEKAVMKKWLAAEEKPTIERKAFMLYYLKNTDKFHEAIVNLSQQKFESNVLLGKNQHGPGDGPEMIEIEQIVLRDAGVQAEVAKLQLPEGTHVMCDPWIYGSDGIDDDHRMYQTFLYSRPKDDVDSNHYASPLPISPVVDTKTMKVCRIDFLPMGTDFKVDALAKHTPPKPNDYMPSKHKLREDLKPLNVVQPQGASFTVEEDGEIISWQKWRIRVGYNYREGMVLYNITYDGRDIVYRVALSDMSIPYADPRPPYHRKEAFDLGDAGAGVMANNLKLGCDCLGSIHYLSFPVANAEGGHDMMENCICVHEQDAGIGWKHTNYRTGHAAVTRLRELVIQSIITVSNYEYIMAFIFNQAGELSYEVRATGILSTSPISQDIKQNPPFGTIVHPGVLASHHQHIFSLRLDPAIDGHDNRIVYEEAYALPRHPDTNPHGTGYITQTQIVTSESGHLSAPQLNRTFKIQNPTKINPVNGAPVAYKIQVPPFQTILADEESYHFKRAEFADKQLYITKYREGELYAGGKYTNQSRGGIGVRKWAGRGDKLNEDGDDVVCWVQFGLNHIPRIEDFPVMPVEVIRLNFKPVNFFDKNPAIDVPPSTQAFNQSTLLNNGNTGGTDNHHQAGIVEGDIDSQGNLGNVHSTNGAACNC